MAENRGRILRAGLSNPSCVPSRRAAEAGRSPSGLFREMDARDCRPGAADHRSGPVRLRGPRSGIGQGNSDAGSSVQGWAELNGGTLTGVTVADALRQSRDDDIDARTNKASPRFQVLRTVVDLTDRGHLTLG